MSDESPVGAVEDEKESLRQENARLRSALEEIRSRLTEPEEVIRAIRHGEIDALVVQEEGQEEIYALQRFDSVYRTVVEECFPYGVWLARQNGKLLYVTESFLRLIGTDLREMRERGQFHFLPPGSREAVEQQWAASRETGLPFNAEYTVQVKDGSIRSIWTQGLIAHTHDGLPHWVGVNIDITHRKQIEDALRESDRHKDEFLATLAHELRNPLAPIRTGLELLRGVGNDRSRLEDVRNMMERQVHQLVRLVDDLMDVSRITRGTVTLRKEPVDLAAVLQSAVEATLPIIEESDHQLTVSLPPTPIHLEADAARLAQVFSNLLTNAARYTDTGGRISITADRDGAEALVTVKDTGIGIAPAMLESIFEMFKQVDRSLERSQSGLGIGLTMVKRLVEMHGGSVVARSSGPGQGSEFIVRLPVMAEQHGFSRPADIDRVEQSDNLRILLVDDNRDAAMMLDMMLRTTGNEIRAVHDGSQAVETAAKFRPDVVLMDIGLPKLNGYEVARSIRQQPWGAGMFLVALTGWGQEEDKQRAREAGFDRHFVKPVEPEALHQLLADYCAGRSEAGPARPS